MATEPSPAGLRRLACLGVQGLDDAGVSGRDRLAPEFEGGGDLVAAGLPGDQQDGALSFCSTWDSVDGQCGTREA